MRPPILRPLKPLWTCVPLLALVFSFTGLFASQSLARDYSDFIKKEEKAPSERLYESLTYEHQTEVRKAYYKAMKQIADELPTARPVIIDLDETVLDNRAFFAKYSEYEPEAWQGWVLEAQAADVPGALDFIEFLEVHNVPYYFLTSRKASWREATVQNLKRLGVWGQKDLFMKPDAEILSLKTVDYKESRRCKVEATTGEKILLVVGDQKSDLKGDCKGAHQVRIPNPLYTIK